MKKCRWQHFQDDFKKITPIVLNIYQEEENSLTNLNMTVSWSSLSFSETIFAEEKVLEFTGTTVILILN